MRAIAALLIFGMLAGCSGGARPRASVAAPVDDGLPLGTLPSQSLAAGDCALFLWKAGSEARLIAMVRLEPAVARIVLDGRILDLARADGGKAFDQARYAGPVASLSIGVDLEQTPGLARGAVVRGGTLEVQRTGGESIVVPVAGMFACR